MSVFAGPEIVNDGLVLSLDAANSKSYPGSGTTWTDLSGNGNNGTLVNGPTFSADKGAIVFDGTNDYIDCGNSNNTVNGLTSFSGIIWLYRTNVSSGGNTFDRILSKRSSTQGSGWWDFYFSSDSDLEFAADFATTDISRKSVSSVINLNQWFMTGFTWNGNSDFTTIKIYFNGKEVNYFFGVTGVGEKVSETTNKLIIGNADFAARPLYGGISLVQLYNRVLTAAEVQQNFNALRGRFGI